MKYIVSFLISWLVVVGILFVGTNLDLNLQSAVPIDEKEMVMKVQEHGNPVVIDKYINSTRNYDSRYILLLDFGDGTNRTLRVTQNVYDSYSIGDTYYNSSVKQ